MPLCSSFQCALRLHALDAENMACMAWLEGGGETDKVGSAVEKLKVGWRDGTRERDDAAVGLLQSHRGMNEECTVLYCIALFCTELKGFCRPTGV